MYHKVGDVARASTVSTVCRCCSLLPSVSHFRELPPFLSLYSKHTEWEWAEGRREGLPLHRNPHLSHRGWKTNKVRLNSVYDAGFLCAWMRFRKRWLTVAKDCVDVSQLINVVYFCTWKRCYIISGWLRLCSRSGQGTTAWIGWLHIMLLDQGSGSVCID